MGVKGLWQLLLPTGRRISIETLTGKTLAIDASIWLVQFIKANRDSETGKVHPAAHIIGFYRRVCKLLFHGIRPVFVFDGATPEIKLREIRARRERREKMHSFAGSGMGDGHDVDGLKRLAKRLLVANLKKQKELEALKKRQGKMGNSRDHDKDSTTNDTPKGDAAENYNSSGGGGGGAFANGFHLPGSVTTNSTCNVQASKNEKKTVIDLTIENQHRKMLPQENIHNTNIDAILLDTKDYLKQNLIDDNKHLALSCQQQQEQRVNDWDNVATMDDQSHATQESNQSYEIPQDENDLNTQVLSSLPTKTRIDIIEKTKRQQRMQSRKEFISVAAHPDSYSQCQLRNFLKSANLSKKIKLVGQMVSTSNEFGQEQEGEKIASDQTRRFIFSKESDAPNVKGGNYDDGDFSGNRGDGGGRNLAQQSKFDSISRKSNSDVDDENRIHKRRRLTKMSDCRSNNSRDEEEDEIKIFDNDYQEHQNCNNDNDFLPSDSDDEGGGGFMRSNHDDGSDDSDGRGFIRLNDSDNIDKTLNHMIVSDTSQQVQKKIMITLSSDDDDDSVNDVIEVFHNKIKHAPTGQGIINITKKPNDQKSKHLQEKIDDNKSQFNCEYDLNKDSNNIAHVMIKIKSGNDNAQSIKKMKLQTELKDDCNQAIDVSKTNLLINEAFDKEEECNDNEDDVDWEDCEAEDGDEDQHEINEEKEIFNVQNCVVEDDIVVGKNDEEIMIQNESQSHNDFIDHDNTWDKRNAERGDEVLFDGIKALGGFEHKGISNSESNTMALKRAQVTASHLTDWAGRAVRRAINAHLIESQNEQPRNEKYDEKDISYNEFEDGGNEKYDEEDISYSEFEDGKIENGEKTIIKNNQKVDNEYNQREIDADINSNIIVRQKSTVALDTSLSGLQEEELQMKEDERRRERDMETITDDMIEEVMQLLELFGIPYLKAPTEAEAQCVTLEKLHLVDGVCTEDSDGELHC